MLSKNPRKWQSRALQIWEQSFRGVVSVVTGGGKTTFALMCMQVFRKHAPDCRFIIVVPTLALLDQWFINLREDLAVPKATIACFSGEDRPSQFTNINLMVMNTAREYACKAAKTQNSMLIVDECHRAATQSNALSLRGKHKATLGISATPEREHDDLFNDVLVPKLGPIIFRYDYNQALRDGVIVPFDLVNVSTNMTREEQIQYDNATVDIARTYDKLKSGTVSKNLLVRKLQRRARMAASSIQRIPVAIRLAEQHRESRMIIFHESIDAAETILKILLARRFNATVYHSRVSPEMRRDNLRLYSKGIFDVLVTCRALDEGVDVPETEIAIVVSSTGSLRQRIQRLGRVLRPALGKPRARIYTIYVSKPEEDRLIREAKMLYDSSSIAWMRSSARKNNEAIV